MKRTIVAVPMLALIHFGSASAQQSGCDRDCLSTALMGYMNAVVANAREDANQLTWARL